MGKSMLEKVLPKAMDEARAAAFEERFAANIAEIFWPVSRDMDERGHREYWLKGGRGSCKSSFAACKILDLLRRDVRASALVLRKVGGTLRDSVYAQMLWALDALGVEADWNATVSPMELTHRQTGQQIIFRGLDEPRKIKSIKPKRGYFAACWFEEAEEYAGYDELRSVMQSAGRGKGARTVFLMTYNPPKSANNWINAEALRPEEGRLVHHSIYTQVPAQWLGEAFLAQAEALRARDERRWRHEYGGEATGDGGAVFDNLEIRPIDAPTRAAIRPLYGLDFGYSCDPSALMTCGLMGKTLYVVDEYYKAGAGFDALERECKRATHYGGTIWADTEPRTIAELYGRGVPIAAARKGRGSRAFGMQWLEELDKIVIDPATCPNAAREFSAFEHARDPRSGAWRADYQDGDDHTIDAVRYACWREIHRNRRTKYFSGKGAVG